MKKVIGPRAFDEIPNINEVRQDVYLPKKEVVRHKFVIVYKPVITDETYEAVLQYYRDKYEIPLNESEWHKRDYELMHALEFSLRISVVGNRRLGRDLSVEEVVEVLELDGEFRQEMAYYYDKKKEEQAAEAIIDTGLPPFERIYDETLNFSEENGLKYGEFWDGCNYYTDEWMSYMPTFFEYYWDLAVLIKDDFELDGLTIKIGIVLTNNENKIVPMVIDFENQTYSIQD